MGRAEYKSMIFMYGEYMNSYNMKFRCPDALCSGMAILDGYRFMINSRGAATIVPDAEGEVQGVLWRVTHFDESDVDLTVGYNEADPEASRCEKKCVTVRTGAGMPVEAFVYIDKDTAPGAAAQSYMQKIISGAAEHAVEKDYIDRVLRKYKETPKRETYTTY